MSGPISWNSDSSRLTSTTWPTPECSATIVAKAATSPVTSSVSAIGGSSGPPSASPLMAANPLIASAMVAKPGSVGVGAVLAEAGDAGDHERRVAGEQHVGTEAEALERAGPEVLDQHVGAVAQAEEDVEVVAGSFRSSAMQRLLRATQLPPQRHAVASGRASPCRARVSPVRAARP